MNFSIIAGTSPMMRVFLASLPQKFGTIAASTYNRSTKLATDESNNSRKRRQQTQESIRLDSIASMDIPTMKPENPFAPHTSEDNTYSYDINPRASASTGNNVVETDDTKSVTSEESRRMIIKKDVGWSVKYSQ